MYVIAISGWKRSGKDTVAQQLIEQHGFKRVSFADPLKNMAAEEYGVQRSYFDDPAYKEAPLLNLPVDPKDSFTETIVQLLENEFKPGDDGNLYWTPRALAILKGSVNRAVDSSFWVKRAIQLIRNTRAAESAANDIYPTHAENLSCKFVISDLRYRSEVEELRDAFGDRLITIRINRFDSVDTTDPSERDLDNYQFDFVIENKQGLDELKKQVRGVIENVGCGQSERTISGAW